MYYYYYGKVEKYKIAEAYIKLNLEYNSINKEKLELQLKKVIEKGLLEFKYKEGISYIIVTEKGSLKNKIIIYGTLIIQGVANYGSIRQGLNQLWTDSKWISEQVITIAINDDNDINDQTIIRTEKRTGLIGRLKRTISKIENLQGNLDNIGNNQVQAELSQLRQDLSNILEMLTTQERNAVTHLLPNDIIENLPNSVPSGVLNMYNRYALKPEDLEIENE